MVGHNRAVLNELYLLAKAYEQDRSRSGHSIFFVILDAAQSTNNDIFTDMNITTVPHLIYLPSGKDAIDENALLNGDVYYQYNLRDGQQAEKIKQFVLRHTAQVEHIITTIMFLKRFSYDIGRSL